MTKKKKPAPVVEPAAQENQFIPRLKLVKGASQIMKEYDECPGRRPLDPSELPELHQRIKEGHSLKLALLEEWKEKVEAVKEVKGRLNGQVKEIEADLSFISTGSRPEERRCLITKDYKAGQCITVDAETGEVYEDRPLHGWERQQRMFHNDCHNCKYSFCYAANDGNCPEDLADCFDCKHFTCKLPGRCDEKSKPGEETASMEEAATLDCLFCHNHKCKAEKEKCGRLSDCYGCESMICTPGNEEIKAGYCKVASKNLNAAMVTQDQTDGEGQGEDAGAEAEE